MSEPITDEMVDAALAALTHPATPRLRVLCESDDPERREAYRAHVVRLAQGGEPIAVDYRVVESGPCEGCLSPQG